MQQKPHRRVRLGDPPAVFGEQLTADHIVAHSVESHSITGDSDALVITDRNMPSGNGEELVRAVQALWPTLPCVVVTGFGGDLRLSVPVIEKPVNAPTFLEAVERALAAS